MTRPHLHKVMCPNCRSVITAETGFGRWMREQPRLDSSHGIVTCDVDHWVHRYKTNELGREFQLIMLVEVKTHGKDIDASQADTLHFVNQLFRNRRKTPTTDMPRRQADGYVHTVRSQMLNRDVKLRAYGAHLLQLSDSAPDTSEWMRWDKRLIDCETLIQLLNFDLDPDKLTPIDLRSHHKQAEFPLLGLSAALV
jgi:RNase P subunit RPR2